MRNAAAAASAATLTAMAPVAWGGVHAEPAKAAPAPRARAEQGRVLIVADQTVPSLKEAAESAAAALSEAGAEPTVMSVESCNSGTAWEAAVVLAVGDAAARAVDERLVSGAPAAYCMVSSATPVFEGRTAVGVRADVSVKARVRAMADMLPRAKRVGVIYRGSDADSLREVTVLEANLPFGWKLESVDADRENGIGGAADKLFDQHVDVIWTVESPDVWGETGLRLMLREGLRRRVPVFGHGPWVVEEGAYAGAGVEAASQGKQGAAAALMVLRGEAGAGHTEMEARTRTVVNVGAAWVLGRVSELGGDVVVVGAWE